MGWYTIANNQTVSFTNLADAVAQGVFVQKTGIPDSNEQITKADADAKVYLDTGYAPFAGKASNQLVVKSNLRPVSYSYTIYYEEACYYDGFYIEGGAASGDIACDNTLTITLYSPVSSFANGMKLFYDAACDNPWYGDTGDCGDYYKVIVAGTSYSFTYANSSSTVGNLTACPVTCSCFLLENTDSVDISISFYDCGGSTTTPECNVCAASSQIYLCIQDGQHTNYTVSYGTNCSGGATPSYTLTALGTTCNNSGDCI
jgi:hypothetical protein